MFGDNPGARSATLLASAAASASLCLATPARAADVGDSSPAATSASGPESAADQAEADQAEAAESARIQRAAWAADDRRLRIQTGVAGGLSLTLLAVGVTLIFVSPDCQDPDPEYGCGEGYGRIYTAAVLIPLAFGAAIATTVFGARLHRHQRSRPAVTAGLGPGGLVLRF